VGFAQFFGVAIRNKKTIGVKVLKANSGFKNPAKQYCPSPERVSFLQKFLYIFFIFSKGLQ
jgi:hypothetical protein